MRSSAAGWVVVMRVSPASSMEQSLSSCSRSSRKESSGSFPDPVAPVRWHLRQKKEKPMALLEVKNLTKRYAGLAAVQDNTFDIATGEVVGLIGPNGSGKSTLFNCITG